MKIKFCVLILFFLLASCARLDESMTLFFPKQVQELAVSQSDFSAFWWNFVIIENSESQMQSANQICRQLKGQKQLRIVLCQNKPEEMVMLIQDWLLDYPLRSKFMNMSIPTYLSSMQQTMIQASFVSEPKVFELLRFDPFGESWKFLELEKKSILSSFTKKNGFYFDDKTQRLLIPIQFNQSSKFNITDSIQNILTKYPNTFLLGGHGASYRNEAQVKKDLQLVSIISAAVFIFFLFLLAIKTRWQILLLAAPVAVAIWIASLIVTWVDGSIHGLTLSFGSGIIGLVLDYGLHGAFGAHSHKTWKSNLIGLLTTLCAIGILFFSGIPLIKQMMLFSLLGLAIGFFLFYIIFLKFSDFFAVQNLNFRIPYINKTEYLILFLVIAGFFSIAKVNLSMDLRSLNFSTEYEKNINEWFYRSSNFNETFLLLRYKNEKDVWNEGAWARKNNIVYEGVSQFLDSPENQLANLNSWQQKGCQDLQRKMNSVQLKFFDLYFDKVCQSLKIKDISDLSEYLQPYKSSSRTLSIFHATDIDQANKITQRFPEAKSLTRSVQEFTHIFEQDLKWMIPVSIILALAILVVYYKSVTIALITTIPFVTGLSLYLLVANIFHFQIDLISILGLVMVFGFSIDYGVFSADVILDRSNVNEVHNVFTALTFASLTNILGFFPMLLAGHPVLFKIGAALFFGTIGTYLGTISGVEPILKRRNGRLK